MTETWVQAIVFACAALAVWFTRRAGRFALAPGGLAEFPAPDALADPEARTEERAALRARAPGKGQRSGRRSERTRHGRARSRARAAPAGIAQRRPPADGPKLDHARPVSTIRQVPEAPAHGGPGLDASPARAGEFGGGGRALWLGRITNFWSVMAKPSPARRVVLLEGLSLGAQHRLHLIETAGERLLIATHPGGVSLLHRANEAGARAHDAAARGASRP